MIRLNINIDHVATLRNQRGTVYPDPVRAAAQCLLAGADGITVHLREDRRHIRDADVEALRASLAGRSKKAVLNLEMAASAEMNAIAERVGPDVVTLVPERREERTTEGGLDALGNAKQIDLTAAACARAGIKLSLFIEASLEQVRASHARGATQVEFHTGHYCEADPAQQFTMLRRLREASTLAHELGLEVAAGHGLNQSNVTAIARLPHLAELNIGHSVVSDALFFGLQSAVAQLRATIDAALRPEPARR